jgi:uncharacterized protein YukE
MPGGRYNLNTIEGVKKKLSALDSKRTALLQEAEGVDKEIEHLRLTLEGLEKAEFFDVFKRSGKTIEEAKTALGDGSNM